MIQLDDEQRYGVRIVVIAFIVLLFVAYVIWNIEGSAGKPDGGAVGFAAIEEARDV